MTWKSGFIFERCFLKATRRLLVISTLGFSLNAFALGGLDVKKLYSPKYVQVMCMVTKMPKKNELPVDAVYDHGACDGLAAASKVALLEYAAMGSQDSSDVRRQACFQEAFDVLFKQDASDFMMKALAHDLLSEPSTDAGSVIYFSMKDRLVREINHCIRR